MIARLCLALALVAALLGGMPAARAADEAAPAAPAAPRLEFGADGDGWYLSADFELPFTAPLEVAVSRGVPLYFVAEFELIRPRWYWWDDKVAERSRVYRLSYNALTRQYRVGVDGVSQPFETLEEALAVISRIRGWKVFDASAVAAGIPYVGQARLRLDVSQLPKPFQVSAMTNRELNPQAPWTRFRFTLPTAKSGQ